MRIIGLAGWSGSGKTTLLAKVIPRLVARGLEVSTLKHAHHAFDVDQPGKDSHTHRMAGATEVLVGSAKRWALVHELRGQAEPALRAVMPSVTCRAPAAIASDAPLPATRVPVVDIDDIERVADILIRHAAPIAAVLAHAESR